MSLIQRHCKNCKYNNKKGICGCLRPFHGLNVYQRKRLFCFAKKRSVITNDRL